MNCKQFGRVCAYSSMESDFATLHNAGGPGFEAVFAIAG